MTAAQRRQALKLFSWSRHCALGMIGFLLATWIYPGSSPVPPSVVLAVFSGVMSLLFAARAIQLWRRA